MNSSLLIVLSIFLGLLTPWSARAASQVPQAPTALDEIIVTATLQAMPLIDLASSVSVLDAGTLRDAGQQHFEEVLALVPNLNWAGDTSRPRYFQIRGVGELEQYQGAPNPSVGFLIDDIDFSGLGGAATLFDVDHIEVLRGPQGTLYGANALAGLIYVQSAEPSKKFGARAEIEAGDYNTRSLGAVVTGPIDALNSAFRLAAQRYTSDGYYSNAYLNRHDTNRRDELTLRARWRYQPTDQVRVDMSLLRVEINNGYDAWAIDNTRTTLSDNPSVDRQYSTGISTRMTCACLGSTTLTAIGTYANTQVRYGYDGDWGNPLLWAPYIYNYTDLQTRTRSSRSLELRLGAALPPGLSLRPSLSWLVGVYAFELREALGDINTGLYIDPTNSLNNTSNQSALSSQYRSRSGAVFGQLDGEIARLRWSAGLRAERRTARYDDLTNDGLANDFRPADNLWGGHFSLDQSIAAHQHLYALVSRGYKAGGFNLSQQINANQKTFAPESVWNFEVGYKAQIASSVRLDSSLFYMHRNALQLKTSEQLQPNNPNSFTYYTGNANSGYTYGLENTLTWAVSSNLEVGGSLGWLQSRYHGFIQNGALLPDRALASAPDWQAAVHLAWRDPHGLFARVDITGSGAFYYDLPPNFTRSSPYGLLNVKLGWEGDKISFYLWGRNLLDKNYTVRGFYFADEPPDFANKLYTQLGDPRNLGIHVTLRY